MRIPESDKDSSLSVSLDSAPEAGPSCVLMDRIPASNGHTNGNGLSSPIANGSSLLGNGVQKHGSSIARVSLPGSTLYDDSYIDRQEFVRLVIQSLRDVGYIESAATLEAESGYSLEAPEVSEFRQYILNASWGSAEALLVRLGVADEESLWEARFLIGQQKYLELLEARKTAAALQVLRNELAPLNVDPDQLHLLSSLMMSSDPEDLRRRAGWDGASGASRQQLLAELQRYIPSTIMIPQRRFSTLLDQARQYQRQSCIYHNPPENTIAFSLLMDHQCDKSAFPRVTTTILEVHADEVWNIAWSHNGEYLASASKDKTAIIWRIGSESEPSMRECAPELILRDHPYSVGCVAWSRDDAILLTSADHLIKMWDARSGICLRTLDAHSETVSALTWLPDGSGFISGGLDRKIILWDAEGKQRDSWGITAMRVTDLAVSPDFSRLVSVGMDYVAPTPPAHEFEHGHGRDTSPPIVGSGNGASIANMPRSPENWMIIYDLASKQMESSIRLDGELTSIKISDDSRYALFNHAPDEIHLWDLAAGQLVRKLTGQRQEHNVIRSCFGGIDGNFIVSGSEDGNVYVWHRDSGLLLEVLTGHGEGSVNSVAWNPRNERMFASCSDDNTIRIWEVPPTDTFELSSGRADSQLEPSGKGKGKVNQQWDGA